MNDHNQAMQWLVMQYHDGQLAERHRPAVEAHLAECEACRQSSQSSEAAAEWLRESAQSAGAVTFGAVWNGVRRRLDERSQWGRVRDWMAGVTMAWPLRPGWLAAGSLAAGLLLTVANPLDRLPAPPSHEAYVAFVEAADYPVMVLPPARSGDMTVIWLFEPQAEEILPST